MILIIGVTIASALITFHVISLVYTNLVYQALIGTIQNQNNITDQSDALLHMVYQAKLIWPANPIIPETYGRLYFYRNDSLNAIYWFSNSQRLNPLNVISLYELGNSYKMNGNYELATKIWRQARAGSYFLNTAKDLDLAGDYSRAINLYSIAVEVNPKLADDIWYWHKGNPYILANSDFTDYCSIQRTPCNWTRRNIGEYLVALDIGHNNRSSVNICSKKDGGYISQRVNVLSNTVYKLTGWIRTRNLRGGAYLVAWRYKSNNTFIETISTKPIKDSSSWTKVTAEIKISNNPEYIVVAVLSSGSGCSWFDNITLIYKNS